MKNYFYIDGMKIPMSDETANSILDNTKYLKSYKDITNILFKNELYFIGKHGEIGISGCASFEDDIKNEANNATNIAQLQSLLDLNKLLNVAKYLNGDKKVEEFHGYWYIESDTLMVISGGGAIGEFIYFQSKKDAEYAIRILGENTIKSALHIQH